MFPLSVVDIIINIKDKKLLIEIGIILEKRLKELN